MSYDGPGLYEHFKGGEYDVIGIAEHVGTGDQLVIYSPNDEASLCARPLDDFNSSVSHEGGSAERFEKIQVSLDVV